MIGEEDFLSRIKICKLQPTLLTLKVNNNLMSVVPTVSVLRQRETNTYIFVINSLRSYITKGFSYKKLLIKGMYYKLNNLNVS